MPRVAKELNAKQVQYLKHDGGKNNMLVAVGGVPGLHVQLSPSGARSWILRAKIGPRRRDIGLGSLATFSLKDARDEARELRKQIAQGRDPIAEKRAARDAQEAADRKAMTFKQAMEIYLTTKIEVGEMTVAKRQWRSTLEAETLPVLGSMQVGEIEVADVLKVLQPIWSLTGR